MIHGTRDTVTPFDESVAYARNVGATLVAVQAGHHAMLVKAAEFDRAVLDFVTARVEPRPEP